VVNMRKDEDLKILQGQRSKRIGSNNEKCVFQFVSLNSPSFSELLNDTGFSKPVLSKHLGSLQRAGYIFKDTVKPHETRDPHEIGKIVYRSTNEQIERFVNDFFALQYETAVLDKMEKDVKDKMLEHYKANAQFLSEWLKRRHPIPPKPRWFRMKDGKRVEIKSEERFKGETDG
jgi:hypothetical protein